MALPTRRATPQRPPTRVRPRLFPGIAFNSGGIAPIVTQGVRRRNLTRGAGRLLGVVFNSGGLVPITTAGVRRRNLTRGAGRIFAPPFNSGGQFPSITSGVRRRNLTRPSGRLFTPAFNSGGQTPITVIGAAHRPPARSLSRLQVAPAAPLAPTTPLVSRGVARFPRPGQRPRILSPPPGQAVVAGTAPVVSRGPSWAAARGRVSRLVVPPTVGTAPPPAVGWSDSAPRRRHTPMAWYRWAWWVLARYPGGDESS